MQEYDFTNHRLINLRQSSQWETNLFASRLPENSLHENFKAICTEPKLLPSRMMINEAFARFTDTDSSFLREFQTLGFNQRLWELYLNETFLQHGFEVIRPQNAPDFRIEKNNQKVFIEAVTTAPPQSNSNFQIPDISQLEEEEATQIINDHFSMRIHNALIQKVNHETQGSKYWELPDVVGNPFVLAIEAFHEPGSLTFKAEDVGRYLYGIMPQVDESGQITHFTRIAEHRVNQRYINSNFFGYPDTQNISAVIFSNMSSQQKFQRMGYLKGYGRDQLNILRISYIVNKYGDRVGRWSSLRDPSYSEKWADGIKIFHNPNAQVPLPTDFFSEHGFIQNTLDDNLMPHEIGTSSHKDIVAAQDIVL